MKLFGTGHRPPKIPWDPEDPIRVAIRLEIHSLLIQLEPELVLDGMAIGFDQDLARVCVDLEIPFEAAVPFKGQELRWPAQAQLEYLRLLEKAAKVTIVCEGSYAAWKMHERNKYMVDSVGEEGRGIALWDGSEGGTGSCLKYAKSKNISWYRIDPDSIVNNL